MFVLDAQHPFWSFTAYLIYATSVGACVWEKEAECERRVLRFVWWPECLVKRSCDEHDCRVDWVSRSGRKRMQDVQWDLVHCERFRPSYQAVHLYAVERTQSVLAGTVILRNISNQHVYLWTLSVYGHNVVMRFMVNKIAVFTKWWSNIRWAIWESFPRVTMMHWNQQLQQTVRIVSWRIWSLVHQVPSSSSLFYPGRLRLFTGSINEQRRQSSSGNESLEMKSHQNSRIKIICQAWQ